MPALSQPPDPPPTPRPGKHYIFQREAVGVLIIGVMILALTLVRFWHHISWNAR
jgi:hypothetical protein